MRIAVGADHGGVVLKEKLTAILQDESHQVEDLGSYSYDPEDDYPDIAQAVAGAVAGGQVERGLLICGSGVGASVAANKVRGVRAAVCHDVYSARQGVEHDDMNILCLGAWVVGLELAAELVRSFLGARFYEEERYQRRLQKVQALEAEAQRPAEG